jgi:outer membrane protein TolC
MIRCWKAAAIVMALLAVAASASAFDLQECLRRGLASSDRVLAAQAQWDKAKMDEGATIPNFLPQISATGEKLWLNEHLTFTFPTPAFPSNFTAHDKELLGVVFGAFSSLDSLIKLPTYMNDLTIKAYEPLSMIPQLAMYSKMADDGRNLAHLGYEVTRDQITLYLSASYFAVLLSQKRVKALQRADEQVNRLLQDGKNMEAQGLITKADLLKFEIRQGEVEIQLLQAKNDEVQARSLLAKLLEMPIDQIVCEDMQIPPTQLHDLDWYVDNGQQGRRELRMTSLQESIARANSTAAYLNLIPQLGAVGQAEWTQTDYILTPDRQYTYGLVLSWNFWGLGKDVLNAQSAAYAKDQATHEARAARIDIRMSIEKAYHDAVVAHQSVDVSQRTLAQAEENFRIEQNRYKAGKTTAYDLLGAQTQLTGAETGYAAAVYGAALADASLDAAIGRKPFAAIQGDAKHE